MFVCTVLFYLVLRYMSVWFVYVSLVLLYLTTITDMYSFVSMAFSLALFPLYCFLLCYLSSICQCITQPFFNHLYLFFLFILSLARIVPSKNSSGKFNDSKGVSGNGDRDNDSKLTAKEVEQEEESGSFRELGENGLPLRLV